MLIGLGALSLASCADDNDSNPTLNKVDTFKLNAPALANEVADLANSEGYTLTWKQPDFGYPAITTYYVQMSVDGTWTEATLDDDGNELTPATYAQLDGSATTVCKTAIDSYSVCRNIMKLAGISAADQVPEEQTVYFRVKAILNSGYSCYSNVVTAKFAPYYIALVAADPVIWYMVGDNIADGSWTNNGIGEHIIPMSIVQGEKYDELTGNGLTEYRGYLKSGNFKFILDPGDSMWTNQIGISDGVVQVNNGGSGNFWVPEDGYYRVTLNTNTSGLPEVAITPIDAPSGVYAQMGIAGSFNGWSFADMSAAETCTSECHTWVITVDWSDQAEAIQFKFLSDSSWAHNWGDSATGHGWGVQGGANITAEPGKYIIIFNDITGYYMLFPQE